MQLQFYGTAGCHLCDDAKEILQQAGVNAAYIDIVGDDELFERYGMRIPVLKRTDNGAELGWPFDVAEMTQFLTK